MPFGVSDGIAIGALLLAGWSTFRTEKFNRRQAAFEETNERLNLMLIEREASESNEQKRADVSADFYKSGANNYRLKVFNRGKATARNVRIEVLDNGRILMQDDIDRKFPVPVLEQHGSVELHAMIHFGSPPRTHVRLTWDDDLGANQSKELHPTW